MSARPNVLGTDEEEGFLSPHTVLVSPFLAKAFGLDEASLAAGSEPGGGTGNSSGDASGSLGSGAAAAGGALAAALRFPGAAGMLAPPPRLHTAPADTGARAALMGTLPAATAVLPLLDAPLPAGVHLDAHGVAFAKRARSHAEEQGGGGAGGGGGDDGSAGKRPRLVWTPQLHKRFVDAVSHLGIKCAVPKTIMQLMNVEGLTRENVASHLQKYRLYLKRLQSSSAGAHAAAAAAGSGGFEEEVDGGEGEDGMPPPGSE